jgi:hypothetical protein
MLFDLEFINCKYLYSLLLPSQSQHQKYLVAFQLLERRCSPPMICPRLLQVAAFQLLHPDLPPRPWTESFLTELFLSQLSALCSVSWSHQLWRGHGSFCECWSTVFCHNILLHDFFGDSRWGFWCASQPAFWCYEAQWFCLSTQAQLLQQLMWGVWTYWHMKY